MRRTTAHDMERLRSFAAAGAPMSVAARSLGMDKQLVRYWDLTLGLGFVRYRRPEPLPQARAAENRVRATMLALRAKTPAG